jgi:hypothetical protein
MGAEKLSSIHGKGEWSGGIGIKVGLLIDEERKIINWRGQRKGLQ